MLATLGWIVIGLIAAIVVLAFLPLRVRLSLATAPTPRAQVFIDALGGLAPSLPAVDTSRPRKEKKKAEKKPRAKRSAKRQPSSGLNMARAFPGLIIGLLRQIRFDYLTVDADFGLGDPAQTGEVFGKLTPLIYGAGWHPKIDVAIRPHFDGPRLDGTCEAALSVRPAALVPPIARFAWSAFGPSR